MKCTEIKENLNTLVDGAAGISQAEEIEIHLGNCDRCSTEFENLQSIVKILRQSKPISAPAFLDDKVLSAYHAFHGANRAKYIPKVKRTEYSGWFGVPRFALAAALVIFSLATISAFQLGKLSASEISVVMPWVQENRSSPTGGFAADDRAKNEDSIPIRFVEVPVIREKIVTRTINLVRDKESKARPRVPAKTILALKNSIEDNGYLTQTNLTGFQPVSELNVRISKMENDNEK